MPSIADRIMKRVRAKGRGKWVFIPKDFLDLGSRAAVDQALSRLAKRGIVRRVGRGFYDFPRMIRNNPFLKDGPAAPNIRSAVDALVRRDGCRLMPGGGHMANCLGLTNAMAMKIWYQTDGANREVKVGGFTIHLRHARPKIMAWHGMRSAPVVLALDWLGPYAIHDPKVIPTLRSSLSDEIKKELIDNSANLPSFAVPVVHRIAQPEAAAQ